MQSLMNIEAKCQQIQQLVAKLPLWHNPKDVPFDNGLYFFYEKGEASVHSPRGRVVRIGNHPRSQNNLKGRLQNHYYRGKNGSVFRKFLGGALMRKINPGNSCLKHWEKQDVPTCPKCRPTEKKVSGLLESNFKFRCVNIKNKKLRNKMEKILIATISMCAICSKPTGKWLGHHAYSEKVRSCGLWNSHSVKQEAHIATQSDLKKFEEVVRSTSAVSGSRRRR